MGEQLFTQIQTFVVLGRIKENSNIHEKSCKISCIQVANARCTPVFLCRNREECASNVWRKKM